MRIVADSNANASRGEVPVNARSDSMAVLSGRSARTERRRFAMVQVSKSVIGAAVGAGFLALVGRPDVAETIALIGLLFPALLAALSFTGVSLAGLETAALASFAGLIGYLVGITGGMQSPLVVWFVLVPAEAALAGGRPTVMRAAAATALALLAVAACQGLALLPASPFHLPGWQLYAASILAAVIQSAFVASAAQERQRQADMAAAEGAAMYRFLADNAMDLITRHGSDGRISFASPAARNLLGRAPEALLGAAPSTLVHPDDLQIMQAALVEASYFGRAAAAEVRLRRADGSYVWTEMRCRPAQPVEGKAADIVAVTRDISDRKAHERELIDARDMAEEANRAKSRFLANMSHELRTPLNAIIGFSEVMTHQLFGPVGSARYLEYAGLINESGGHLLELINGILDMSKIEAGKFELAEERFDLEDVAGQALAIVKIQADRKGVGLAMNVPEECRHVFADKRAVKQIVVNLLSNGVKFTPRGGSVHLGVRRDEGGIELAVADTGVGISQTDLKRLGQPFEQAEGAHVRTQEGTGLGLALVKAFAAMHGGEAKLESVLGEGTTVRVRLPYAATGEDGERLGPVCPLPRMKLRGAA
jgi:cell cycle sensor histidine kinase DivJ